MSFSNRFVNDTMSSGAHLTTNLEPIHTFCNNQSCSTKVNTLVAEGNEREEEEGAMLGRKWEREKERRWEESGSERRSDAGKKVGAMSSRVHLEMEKNRCIRLKCCFCLHRQDH